MIGVFDSGMGGLTVLCALRARAPDADIVYFGDTKNAPYGNKSREELSALTARGFHTLQSAGATNFVSACNSVSASVTERLLKPLAILPEDVIEMSHPTVAHFKKHAVANILLVATNATIQSGMYQQGFDSIGIDISTLAIPELAGAIEAGKTDAEIEEIVRAAFGSADVPPFDTLILGCTHFPLVTGIFNTVLSEKKREVEVFDPAEPVAAEALKRFSGEGSGILRFLISKDSESFRNRVGSLFPENTYTIEVIV